MRSFGRGCELRILARATRGRFSCDRPDFDDWATSSTIIGVTRAGFTGPEIGHSFDLAVPICSHAAYWTDGNWLDSSTDWWLTVMGRLKPGKSLAKANAELKSLSPAAFEASLRKDYPTENVRDYQHFELVADSASGGVSWLRNKYENPLWMLLGLAGVVLLIACANLANLMLARGSARLPAASRAAVAGGDARPIDLAAFVGERSACFVRSCGGVAARALAGQVPCKFAEHGG